MKDHIAEGSITQVDAGWTWKFDPHIFLSSRMEPEELAAIDCAVALIRGERGMATTDITDVIDTHALKALQPSDFEMVEGGTRVDFHQQNCTRTPVTN